MVAGVLVMAGGAQAAGTALDVTFTGALVDRMCQFEQGDAPLEVTFPTRALKYFEQYGRTETETFAIGLKDCTSSTQAKLVDLTFAFPQTQVVNGVSMLKPSGDTGLLIGLLDGKNAPIVPDKAVEMGTITQTGDGTLNRFMLGAYVMSPPDGAVKAGQYSATTTFTVSYR
ncbi:type 1 fimbrial protein [Salmonella enterica]|uniref:Type 1 fimbrial protein n=1 Tax=Salmonella enterica TaxID=28901 RepID=A0A5U7LUQ0_SALER|nr:type 1 fimbrial protein [Salmonella enterica]EBP3305629.1 type 1 fimbrial protein [Salmonella enterica subsp. enterica]EBR4142588.1 type 1 fimbrial protein [Salmonella enterica]ECF6571756.1 type 1 fimbrial protein [Salmonella enterica]EDC2510669.1 type 1 fimbrial protein [Salmonella enterica]